MLLFPWWVKESHSPFCLQRAKHSCSRATPENDLTMMLSSAWHCMWEEQEHLAGPDTQLLQGISEVVVEKV